MEEQFVIYEIALAMKELGFDEPCFGYFNSDEELIYGIDIKMIKYAHKYHREDDSVLSPLWQQAIDWFRNEHDIVIEIVRQKYFDTYANSYAYEVVCKVYKNKELEGSVVIRDNKNNHIFYSYEEAREQAILKTIELCQKEK